MRRMILGLAALAALSAAAPAAAEPATVAYGSLPRQQLDIYVPGPAVSKKYRVIVFVHGGAWKYGSKERYRFIGQALAARGYIAVLPNYRLHPEGRFPGFVHDAAKAVAWVMANIARYGGDAKDIWLMGHSAGAHISALVALDRRYLRRAAPAIKAPHRVLRGVIGLAGPYVFEVSRLRLLQQVFGHHTPARETQPITYARIKSAGRRPVLLLLNGANDRLVRPRQAHALALAYKLSGGLGRAIIYPQQNHLSILLALVEGRRGYARIWQDIEAFMAAGLKRGG